MADRAAIARASAVSRVLAKAGERPLPSGTPRSRQGLRVTASSFGRTRVHADIDSYAAAARRADDAARVLEEAGYQVTKAVPNGAIRPSNAFYVQKKVV